MTNVDPTPPTDLLTTTPRADDRAAVATGAILLHGGRCLIMFTGAVVAPPTSGFLVANQTPHRWAAEAWLHGDGDAGPRFAGVALVERFPLTPSDHAWSVVPEEVGGRTGDAPWRLMAPASADVDPRALATFVTAAGGDPKLVFRFLSTFAAAGEEAPRRAMVGFAKRFLAATARHDGFIEIVASPDGGGLYLQGWSMTLGAGAHRIISLAADDAIHEAVVATFEREDILPPGTGFCAFVAGPPWAGVEGIEAIYVDAEDGLLRLDTARPAAICLHGVPAVDHVRAMLPRMLGADRMLRAFKRICRPRFAGQNTLATWEEPVVAALDVALLSPRGDLMLKGWVLDPLRRVAQLLVKSTHHAYARLDDRWVRLSRPDLLTAFAQDPRFRGRLSANESYHGFFVVVSAADFQPKVGNGALGEVYLEIVLDDESCAFLPLQPDACRDVTTCRAAVADLFELRAERRTIVREHLAPFVEGLAPAKTPRQPGGIHVLGQDREQRSVSALIPVDRASDLPPLFSLLAGTADAQQLDLVLVTPRDVATTLQSTIDKTFEFYDLAGVLVTVPEETDAVTRLAVAVEIAAAPLLLSWAPGVLPRYEGWSVELVEAFADLGPLALLSPTLLYEDGSIAYGGTDDSPCPDQATARHVGYGENWLRPGSVRSVAFGARELFLMHRSGLDAIGGLASGLVGDSLLHVDLATRLRAAGGQSFWTPNLAMWRLEDPRDRPRGGWGEFAADLDAALVDRRRTTAAGPPVPAQTRPAAAPPSTIPCLGD